LSQVIVIEPEQLQELITSAVRAALSSAPPQPALDWVDQKTSPLGPKRHCAAVRRRVAAGSSDAAIVGRRYLLAPAAITDELARLDEPAYRARQVARSSSRDIVAELEAELEGAK